MRFAPTDIVTLFALLSFATVGCEMSSRTAPDPDSQTRDSGIVNTADHKNTILPGVGLDCCHIGRPISQLGDNWIRIEEDAPDSELFANYLTNLDAGLGVVHDGEHITCMSAKFLSERHQRFAGDIQGGISASSSIEEVIRRFGQPKTISVSVGSRFVEFPDAKEVDLYYPDKGIDFFFINGTLAQVVIRSTDTNYKRDPWLWEDTGETLEYRAIEPD